MIYSPLFLSLFARSGCKSAVWQIWDQIRDHYQNIKIIFVGWQFLEVSCKSSKLSSSDPLVVQTRYKHSAVPNIWLVCLRTPLPDVVSNRCRNWNVNAKRHIVCTAITLSARPQLHNVHGDNFVICPTITLSGRWRWDYHWSKMRITIEIRLSYFFKNKIVTMRHR